MMERVSPMFVTLREKLQGLAARPLLLVVTGLIVGLCLAHAEMACWWQFVPAGMLLVVLWRSHSRYLFSITLLFVAAMLLGLRLIPHKAESSIPPDHLLYEYANRPMLLTAIVQEAPERGARASHLLLKAQSCRLPESGRAKQACQGLVLLYITDRSMPWRAGDRVQARIMARPTRDEGIPGAFDYATYLNRRGIYATAYVKSSRSVRIVNGPENPGWIVRIERMRSELAYWLEQQAPPQTAEALKALVLGMRKGLDGSVSQIFQQAGTAHLLAISGMHLGVLTLWIYHLVAILWRRSEMLLHYVRAEQAASFAALPAMWLYACMAGLRVATLRAGLVISIYLLGRLLWRRSDAINSLCIAALIILIATPYALFEVGFQLSFLSVLAIVLAVRRIQAALPLALRRILFEKRWRGRIIDYLLLVTITSLVCFLATAPVIVSSFHRLSLVGPLVNVLVVPVFALGIIPLLGLVTGFWLLGFDLLAGWLVSVPSRLFDIMVAWQGWLVKPSFSSLALPDLPVWILGLYWLGLWFLLQSIPPLHGQRGQPESRLWSAWSGRKTLACASLLCLLLAFLMTVWRYFYPPPWLEEWTALIPPMSQGSTVFVHQDDGGVQLVSPGRLSENRSDPVKRVIAPVLWNTGQSRVTRLWRSTFNDQEQAAQQALESLFSVEEVEFLWRAGTCRRDGPLRRCMLKEGTRQSVVWLFEKEGGRRSAPRARLLDMPAGKGRLLIAVQPHRMTKTDWQQLAARLPDAPLAVVCFGPGRVETLAAMGQELKPESVVLAMNRRLARYLSDTDWQRMREQLPGILRTDRHGTVVLDAALQANTLAKPSSFSRNPE